MTDPYIMTPGDAAAVEHHYTDAQAVDASIELYPRKLVARMFAAALAVVADVRAESGDDTDAHAADPEVRQIAAEHTADALRVLGNGAGVLR
jgi:hypothetical protein